MENPLTRQEPPQAACLAKVGLQTYLSAPGDPEYQASIDSYFSNTAKLRPACIFFPRTADHVSTAVRALVTAKEKFAIRSGGHAPLEKSNNIHSGVTIDLSYLDSIKYDTDSELVTFGPGVRWNHVYRELGRHGRIVAGGREGETGVGFGCDNVVSYRIVLADGQMITVAQGMHTDLFRALKGGSNNFGIVVSFTMRTIPRKDIWGGTTMASKQYTSDAIRAVTDFTTNIPNYPDSSLIAAVSYIPQAKDIVVSGALVDTRGTEDSPAFAQWLKIPKMIDTTAPKSIIDMGLETAQPFNMFTTWFTLTIKNDARIMSKAAEVHNILVDELKSYVPEGDFITQCIFQPLPTAFSQRSAEAGGNVMGIERTDSDGIILQLNAMMKTPDQSKFAHRKVEASVEVIKKFAETIEGGLQDWIYLNYADGSQDPIRSYGIENVRFLKRVASTYDPDGAFQTLCPGGFKLPNGRQAHGLQQLLAFKQQIEECFESCQYWEYEKLLGNGSFGITVLVREIDRYVTHQNRLAIKLKLHGAIHIVKILASCESILGLSNDIKSDEDLLEDTFQKFGKLSSIPPHTAFTPLKSIMDGPALALEYLDKGDFITFKMGLDKEGKLMPNRHVMLSTISVVPINLRSAVWKGELSRAGNILPALDNSKDDPFPQIDMDLRDLIARCMYVNSAKRPSLQEALDMAKTALSRAPDTFPDPDIETDDAIREFWQEHLHDVPAEFR
ncbi:hypothetical protein NUW58_g251 [Xylaria curta]|uniref:Uncharacterized protein n=1 Tax=Xylaria curta TaxID=42375 RepID=A0ACC1PSH1_9PEZI|nr:hypothetical protein NUW58_g251 [Xylaria curta]